MHSADGEEPTMRSKIYDPAEHEIIKDQAGLKIQAGLAKPEKHTIKAFCYKPRFRASRVKTLDYYVQAQMKEKAAVSSPGKTSGAVSSPYCYCPVLTVRVTSELSVNTSH